MTHAERLNGPRAPHLVPSACPGELVSGESHVDPVYSTAPPAEVLVVVESCPACGARLSVESADGREPYVRNAYHPDLAPRG